MKIKYVPAGIASGTVLGLAGWGIREKTAERRNGE